MTELPQETYKLEAAELVERLYQTAFMTQGSVEDRAMVLAELILTAASQQIRNETTIESPWFIPNHVGDEEEARRLKIQEHAAYERALQITESWRAADERAQGILVDHFRQRQLLEFPPNGTFETLGNIVRNILPKSRAGSVLATVGFTEQLEEEGIDNPDLVAKAAKLVAKRGPYSIGVMGAAYNSAKREASADPDNEFDAEVVLDTLLDDADRMSIREFEREHKGQKGVAPLAASRIQLDQGGALFVIRADEPRQATILTTRMTGMLDMEGTTLITPMSPDKLLVLIVHIAQEHQDAYLIGELTEMLKGLVLGDPVCYDIYRCLQATDDDDPWLTLRDLRVLRSRSQATIRDGLNRLVYYGVILEERSPGKATRWAIERPRKDDNEQAAP